METKSRNNAVIDFWETTVSSYTSFLPNKIDKYIPNILEPENCFKVCTYLELTPSYIKVQLL